MHWSAISEFDRHKTNLIYITLSNEIHVFELPGSIVVFLVQFKYKQENSFSEQSRRFVNLSTDSEEPIR